MGDNPEASRLFRIQKTLIKMLQDRGYAVNNKDELSWTMDQVGGVSLPSPRSGMAPEVVIGVTAG